MAFLLNHENQNQFLLVFNNWFYYILFSFVGNCCLVLHYVLLPLIWSSEILYHLIPEFRFLFYTLFQDVKRVFSLLQLNLSIFIIILLSAKNYIFHQDSRKHLKQAIWIYSRMKRHLQFFHVLPFSPHNTLIAYLLLKKIPQFVWKCIVPFPNFLFEDTFSSVPVGDNCVLITLPPTGPTIIIKHEELKNESSSE